ncbi:MAG: hypothetical protein AAF389_19565 [Gemmatimonadota bacterium]
MKRPTYRLVLSIALAAIALTTNAWSQELQAQVPGSNAGRGARFGIALGGIGRWSGTVELYDGANSAELGVGLWSGAVSVSVVGKRYFFGSRVRPVAGAGLWLVASGAGENGSRSAWALVLRAPVGVDAGFADHHALGLIGNLNRALWVRRGNPEDTAPSVGRLVPLPELYYRYAR